MEDADQQSIAEADDDRQQKDQRRGFRPTQALVYLQADGKHLRHTEVVADGQVELLCGERHHLPRAPALPLPTG